MSSKAIIKPGVIVTKVLIWNKVESDYHNEPSECELTFSDGSVVNYGINDVDELEDQNKGIYELLPDGTYIQIEDWE